MAVIDNILMKTQTYSNWKYEILDTFQISGKGTIYLSFSKGSRISKVIFEVLKR